MGRQPHWAPALIAALLCLRAGAQLSHGAAPPAFQGGRRLRQADRVVFDDTSDSSLEDVVAGLQDGQTLVVNSERVDLTAPLQVNASVTVTGAGQGARTELVCAPGSSALIVRGNSAFEDLAFIGCVNASAVEILDSESTTNVTFRRVSFENNAASGASLEEPLKEGGAIFAGRNSSVTILDSTFFNNSAFAGGAVFAVGDLEIQGSTFNQCRASTDGGAIQSDPPIGQSTFLRVDSCQFTQNSALNGRPGNAPTLPTGEAAERLQFSRLPFPNNGGGAIAIQDALSVEINNTLFSNNSAPAGGALYISMPPIIFGPLATENAKYSVLNSEFESNSAVGATTDINHGGAIFMSSLRGVMTEVDLLNVTFVGGTANFGGGLHLLTDRLTTVRITKCMFEGNRATTAGGAVVARTATEMQWISSTAKGNSAQLGGGIYCTNGAMISIGSAPGDTESLLEGNTAVDGGAFMSFGCQNTRIVGVNITNNTAIDHGGGLHFVDSPPGATTLLTQVMIENNTALRGGALSMDSVVVLTIVSSTVKDNRAVEGGGMFLVLKNLQRNTVQVSRTVISDNQALRLSQLQGRLDEHNARVLGGGRSVAELLDNIVEPLLYCGEGGGGGMCGVLSQVPERAAAEVDFIDSVFQDNSATNGGGFFVNVIGDEWKRGNCQSGPSAGAQPVLSAAICRNFLAVNVTLIGNSAEWGGGGAFVSDPDSLFVRCEAIDVTGAGNMTFSDAVKNIIANPEIDPTQAGCLGFKGNSVGARGFGSIAGTRAFSLVVTTPMDPISNHTSSTVLAEEEGGMAVTIYDAFDQKITGGILDAERPIRAQSPSILGQTIAQAKNGTAVFEELIGFDRSGQHNLSFQSIPLEPVHTTFIIRNCSVGEASESGGKSCRLCARDFFTFRPNISCLPCPSQANCIGGAALTPLEGYWHSTPFSPMFHRCIVREACVYANRGENLTKFFSDLSVLKPSNVPLSNEEYQQCAKGYKGVLCGSCEEGYGHHGGGECEECKTSQAGTTGLIFLFALWSLVLVTLEVINAITTNREMASVGDSSLKAPREEMPPFPPAGFPQNGGGQAGGFNGTPRHENANSPLPRPMAQTSSINLRLDPNYKGNSTFLRAVDENDSLLHFVEIEDRYLPEHVLAQEDLTETLKIMVNFLQVTSVAVSINVGWVRVVEILLSIEELLAGLSNGAELVPLDCALEDGSETPKSVRAVWLRIMFPVILLVLHSLFVIMFWATRQVQNKRRGQGADTASLVTTLTVVTITVVFFAYNSVTEELMRTVNCIDVDSKDSTETFSEYAAATRGMYWAEDTALICFEGKHLATAIMGIIFLILFSLGFIVFIVWWLWLNQDELDRLRNITRYGFIFRAYRKGGRTSYDRAHGSGRRRMLPNSSVDSDVVAHKEIVDHRIILRLRKLTVYWEAVITMRKAMISAAVVFAYKLGGNLQGILALGVLVLALAVQLLFKPYRKFPCFNTRRGLRAQQPTVHDRVDLNHLESFSIFASIVTFYAGVVFNDENTTEGGTVVMTVFVLFVNIVLLVYFLWRMYEGTHVMLDLKLKDHGWGSSPFLVRKLWMWFRAVQKKRAQQRRGGDMQMVSVDTSAAGNSLDAPSPSGQGRPRRVLLLGAYHQTSEAI
ncbi:unnamed protein product [Ostreobium quekettii]|uniref:Uncharacterized protein n=1 Tax=Ostreobium quekettii TaxID=121088 RepID=A0A8S1JCU1_9CHLO|nr:unnamed protein product [Ostreobium quekettii]|eukprot:evm.model.scf_1296.3 EVM.evm.TU.scf_1296.3   scf_1296:19245-32020(-)